MSIITYLAGSSSSKSINREFAKYTANNLGLGETQGIDLNHYEAPIFSVDQEKEGVPPVIKAFIKVIEESDVIVLSLAEHNGNFTVAFKNIMDWASRVDRSFWSDKPIFLLSTSPGSRGGRTVLNLGKKIISRMGGRIVAEFSLPQFNENFSPLNGVLDKELRELYKKEVERFIQTIKLNNNR